MNNTTIKDKHHSQHQHEMFGMQVSNNLLLALTCVYNHESHSSGADVGFTLSGDIQVYFKADRGGGGGGRAYTTPPPPPHLPPPPLLFRTRV